MRNENVKSDSCKDEFHQRLEIFETRIAQFGELDILTIHKAPHVCEIPLQTVELWTSAILASPCMLTKVYKA